MQNSLLSSSLTILLTLSALFGCSRQDNDSMINNMISKGVEYAQNTDINRLMDMASSNFKAQQGRYNARSIKPVLRRAFRYYGNFTLHHPNPKVTITDPKATAVIYFVIIRQDHPLPGLADLYDNPEKWLQKAGEKADLYQLDLTFHKNSDTWQVVNAELRGFRGWRF